ncbi:MAG: hypothetical protein MUE54_01890 [Anaerolineae bacterium]|jgi:hypothetical protein|nr:hypothetical protein [Anaerolineae bacterium]
MDDEKNTQPQNTPTDDESVDNPIVSESAETPDESVIEAISNEPELDDVSLFSDDLDIESALASVANLSALITDTNEVAQVSGTTQSIPKETAPPMFESDFPRPPLFTLERGQMPSVIPALALMAIGAGLTFLLITGAESVNTGMVSILAVGGICVLLLLVWLANGRWARGALFLALMIGSTAGILTVLPQTEWNVNGLPLLLCGWGASVILSGWLSPKGTPQGLFTGILLIIMGISGFVFTAGFLPTSIMPLINQYGYIILGIIAVILFIPALFKRRG